MRLMLIVIAGLLFSAPLQAQLLRPRISERTIKLGLVGAAGGAIIAVATAEKCTDQDWVCFGPEIHAIMGAGVGFLAGATIGIIIDAFGGPDPDRVQIRMAPDRASVRVSLPLPHPGRAR